MGQEWGSISDETIRSLNSLPQHMQRRLQKVSSLDDLLRDEVLTDFLKTHIGSPMHAAIFDYVNAISPRERESRSRIPRIDGRPLNAAFVSGALHELPQVVNDLYLSNLISPENIEGDYLGTYVFFPEGMRRNVLAAYTAFMSEPDISMYNESLPYLSALAVDDEYQGRGLGVFAIDHFVETYAFNTGLWWAKVADRKIEKWLKGIYELEREWTIPDYKVMVFTTETKGKSTY